MDGADEFLAYEKSRVKIFVGEYNQKISGISVIK